MTMISIETPKFLKNFISSQNQRNEGEIRLKLGREENVECVISINGECKTTSFTLTISDDGVIIPKDLDIEDLDSLELQLVTTLVDQLDANLN